MSSRALYHARIAAGLCGKCGRPVVPGRTRCAEHLAVARERAQVQYEEASALGLCVVAGCSTAAEPGARCCAAHAAARAEMLAQRRADKIERGECVRCTERAAPGHILCPTHVQADRAEGAMERASGKADRDRERRASYREHGLCPLCGDARAEGVVMCERHREHAREYAVMYRRGNARWLDDWLARIAAEERERDAAIAEKKLAAWRKRIAAEERRKK